MNKAVRIILILLAFVAVAVAAYFGIKALSGQGGKSPAGEYPWVTVDETYSPRNSIEEFIKSDATEKGLLPIYLRNYGQNVSILKKFRGSNFAGANEAVLRMAYRGMEDWMLVDLKYKNEKQQDIQRTVLYVEIGGQWRVADSGRLMK
jgi:hypothetical protein